MLADNGRKTKMEWRCHSVGYVDDDRAMADEAVLKHDYYLIWLLGM